MHIIKAKLNHVRATVVNFQVDSTGLEVYPMAVALGDCEKLCEERGFEVIWDKLGQGDSAHGGDLVSAGTTGGTYVEN